MCSGVSVSGEESPGGGVALTLPMACEFARMGIRVLTIANPMLNGETIRLDGAIRMAPK